MPELCPKSACRTVVNFEAIPAELRAIPRWIVWRYLLKEGRDRPDKVPMRWDDLKLPSAWSRPRAWRRFEQARAVYESCPDLIDGVGFVPTPDLGLLAVDLDNVVSDSGVLSEAARHIVIALDSYTELSP